MATQTRRLSLFLTDGANDFMHALAAETRTAAQRRGFTLDVHFAENQAVQQIQQIYHELHAPEDQRPEAALVLPVHDNTLERVARSAAGAGVGWICLHRATGDLDAIRAEHPEVPISLVGPDQEEIGRLQGRKLIAFLKHGGRVLYIQGRTGNSSVPRRAAGLRESIRGTGIEIGDTIDGNWNSSDAEQAVGRWLRLMIGHVNLHGVVCQNDAMAVGVRRAIRQAAESLHRPDLLKLPVLGCDGLEDVGRKLVDQGELAATVVLPFSGGVAVDLFADAKASGQMPPREVVLKPHAYPSVGNGRPAADSMAVA